MVKNKAEVLAIIPARGGSKGIPRKNICLVAGHPLIAYSIVSAQNSKWVTRVIVSTDDQEIADIASTYGCEVPFLRPSALARDDTRDLPVFIHALSWLKDHERYEPDAVVHLRPTSPTRARGSIDRAIHLLMEHPDAHSVRSIITPDQNPFKMWRIKADGYLETLLPVPDMPESYNAPRQALPETYWHNGQIDVIRTTTLLNGNSMSGDRILPILLASEYSLDIDTPDSLQYADWLIHSRKLDMDYPGKSPRKWPQKISMVVFDFDGVFTDNRVWVDESGREMVAAYRSDSFGTRLLNARGIDTLVISTETNPVVAERCRKVGIDCIQGVQDKKSVLKQHLEKGGVKPEETIFVGNDINDLGCFELVGYSVAVADALPEVLHQADLVLDHPGGHGAVREICDMILAGLSKNHR